MSIPSPDTSALVMHNDCPVTRVVYSANKARRAIIVQDGTGVFRVYFQNWCTSDWDIIQDAYWLASDQSAVIVDSLEHAIPIASEGLA